MEFSIDEKLKLVDDMCSKKYNFTHKFNYVYPFTTENIVGYLPLFDFDGKTLLTVGSSCDQALNAILCGVSGVTVFDICPFVREYFYLKKAAIQSLSKEEYLSFFCNRNSVISFSKRDSAFSINKYLKIREVLKSSDESAKLFWDEVFNKYSGITVRKCMFSTDEHAMKVLTNINNYLVSDANYQELAQKIDNVDINFVQGDIFNDVINGTYDNIFLSNLACYYKLAQMNELFLKMLPHLNDNGKIMIAYLYETDLDNADYMDGEAEIYDLFKVFQTFPKEIKLNSFIGVRGLPFHTSRIKDSVITYKKVKKI